MTHTRSRLFRGSVVGLLTLASLAAAQEEEATYRSGSIQVGALGSRSPSSLRDAAWAHDLRPLGLPLRDDLMDELLIERAEPVYPDPGQTGEACVEMAMGLLPEEIFESEGVAVYAEGTRIHVRGPETLHTRMRQTVGAIRRTMERTVVLRVRQLAFETSTWDALADERRRLAEGTADAAVLERMVGNDLWSGARVADVEIQPGTWGTVESIATQRYLADLDAEVAQDAALYRPVVRTLREGYVLRLRPQLRHDGGVTVECSASEGRGRISSGDLDIGSEENTALDRVHYEGTEMAATLALGQSGSIRGWTSAVLDSRGQVRRRAWTLEVVEVRGASRAGAFAIYPIGSIGAVGGLPRYQVTSSDDAPAPTRIPLLPEEEPRPPLRYLDAVFESLQSWAMDPDDGGGFIEMLPYWNGGCVLVHEEPEVLDRIEKALDRMEDALLRSRTVTLRIDEVSPEGPSQIRFESACGVLDGTTASIGGRSQRNLVIQLNPETAHSSKILDPEPAVLDLGTFVNLTTSAAEGGLVRVELDLRLRVDQGMRSARVPAAGASVLELPGLLDVARAQTLTLPVGETRRIELGPATTPGNRLVATLRID